MQNVISLSEVGLCRSNNQDTVLAVHTEAAGLFAVADGMGGHDRGELASQAAAASLQTWWEKMGDRLWSMDFQGIVRELEAKVREINTYIFQMYQKSGQRGGTTLCLLFVRGDAYAVMNIGDSRLYRVQGRNCVQVTRDDVWENQPSVRQTMSEAEIRNSPSYGKLIQALGANSGIRISVQTGSAKKRTCFLLCSDGIYKYCREWWFKLQLKKVRNGKDMDEFAKKVRKEVYENGAKDNLSLVMVLLG